MSEIIREAADPHLKRGIKIESSFSALADADMNQPVVFRRPEIIHGLRNMVQNAISKLIM